MSFAPTLSKHQFNDEVTNAINNDDEVTLYMKANQAKANGEDEQAEELIRKARQAQRNTESYDEARDNDMTV